MNLNSKNSILIIGSLIVAYYAYKWYDIEQKSGNLSFEPTVTLAASALTVLGYFFSDQFFKKSDSISNVSYINQKHTGKGDNVAGDKIINEK